MFGFHIVFFFVCLFFPALVDRNKYKNMNLNNRFKYNCINHYILLYILILEEKNLYVATRNYKINYKYMLLYLSFLHSITNISFNIFFFHYMAAPAAYGNSWVGAKLELQLLTYATATETQVLNHICDLHHSLWQCRILNPLNEARDQTHILMDTSRCLNPLRLQWELCNIIF